MGLLAWEEGGCVLRRRSGAGEALRAGCTARGIQTTRKYISLILESQTACCKGAVLEREGKMRKEIKEKERKFKKIRSRKEGGRAKNKGKQNNNE